MDVGMKILQFTSFLPSSHSLSAICLVWFRSTTHAAFRSVSLPLPLETYLQPIAMGEGTMIDMVGYETL